MNKDGVVIDYAHGRYWWLTIDLRHVLGGPFETIAAARTGAPIISSEGVNLYRGKDAEFFARMK